MRLRNTFAIWLLLVVSSLRLQAAITVLRYYRLGDADSGAVAGGTATNSIDSAGTNDLLLVNSPAYSSEANNFSSPLGLSFAGTNYGRANVISGLVDNFGIELWVNPLVDSGNHYLAFNGITGTSGWGIHQAGNIFEVIYPAKRTFGSVPVITNQWTHLALVRDSGVSTLYVNGVAATSVANTPNTPTAVFALGVATAGGTFTSEFFKGELDEVRVFSFTAGQFSTNDLTFFSSARLLHVARAGDTVIMSWPTNEVNLGLQYATALSPSNWITLHRATLTNGFYTVQESATNQTRYYRLITPCAEAGPPVVFVRTNGVLLSNLGATVPIRNGLNNIWDALDSYDPAATASGTLTFHWVITSVSKPDGYTDRGMTGYRQPVLNLSPNSMLGGSARFTLTVTSSLTGLATVVNINSSVTGSALSPTAFDVCQSQTNACSTCPCVFPTALPASEPP